MLAFRETAVLFLATMFALSATPGLAQQTQQNQQDGMAPADGPVPDQAGPVVVLDFEATRVQDGDLLAAAAEMARERYVARIDIPADAPTATGVLVFRDLDAFVEWRTEGMSAFFNPLGDGASVSSNMRIFRPDLLRRGDPEALEALEGVTVKYENEDNDAAGDADVDAVTTICAAGADCSPSN